MKDDKTRTIKNLKQEAEIFFEDIECLVIIYGKNIGRKFDLLEEEVTIGRDPENSIVISTDTVSRKHAKLQSTDGGWFIVDTGSINGTFVNDTQIDKENPKKLKSGDLIKIGDTIFKFLSGSNIETAYYEEIHRMAITDGLTQISNKRYLVEFLEREISRARRHHRSLSILILDIDHFKNINDTYGHLIGDSILKGLASLISQRMRKEELFSRFGGEEFIAVLPETPLESAVKFAEIIRTMVAQHKFIIEKEVIPLTISIGVAEFEENRHRFVDDLINEADKNLYKAKNSGRNKVSW